MAIVTLERLIGDITGKTVKELEKVRKGEKIEAVCGEHEFAVVPTAPTLSCRGVFDRWVPARSEGYGGLVEFKQRLKAAWGVLTGRYDAFDWSLTDDQMRAKK